MPVGWPSAVWLVRHGESVGNVASQRAVAEGRDTVEIDERDADVGLTERGELQAQAVGRYLAEIPAPQRPTVVLCSPYLRAQQTAVLALDCLDDQLTVVFDERLRDRELGVLDRLTQRGVASRYPDQAEARRRLGKFYHRPPGGESWVDVLLRLRSVALTLRSDYRGERVIIFTHDVVVLLFRYLFEELDEASVMDVSRRALVVNGGVTRYELEQDKGLVLRMFNAVITPDGQAVTENHLDGDH